MASNSDVMEMGLRFKKCRFIGTHSHPKPKRESELSGFRHDSKEAGVSIPQVRSCRLVSRTSPFHGENVGAIPAESELIFMGNRKMNKETELEEIEEIMDDEKEATLEKTIMFLFRKIYGILMSDILLTASEVTISRTSLDTVQIKWITKEPMYDYEKQEIVFNALDRTTTGERYIRSSSIQSVSEEEWIQDCVPDIIIRLRDEFHFFMRINLSPSKDEIILLGSAYDL